MNIESDEQGRKEAEQATNEQAEADHICIELSDPTRTIVKQDGVQTYRPTALRRLGVGLRYPNYLEYADSSRLERVPRWESSTEINLEETGVHKVTLSTYGSNNPLRAIDAFVKISGSDTMLQMTTSGGKIWTINPETGMPLQMVRKANLAEAKYYQGVVSKIPLAKQ